MSNKRNLNLKNMEQAYLSSLVGDKPDKVYDTFYTMQLYGFMNRNLFIKFAEKCANYYWDEDTRSIYDTDKNGNDYVIYKLVDAVRIWANNTLTQDMAMYNVDANNCYAYAFLEVKTNKLIEVL